MFRAISAALFALLCSSACGGEVEPTASTVHAVERSGGTCGAVQDQPFEGLERITLFQGNSCTVTQDGANWFHQCQDLTAYTHCDTPTSCSVRISKLVTPETACGSIYDVTVQP